MHKNFNRVFASRLLSIIGTVSFCVAAMGLLVAWGKGFSGGDVFLIVLLCCCGFLLKKGAKRIEAEEEKAKQYLTIIIDGKVCSLMDIARTTGKAYGVVHMDVTKMIQRGQLKDAYIDEQTRQVVLTRINTSGKTVSGKAKIIHCSNCGANNTVYGNNLKCEYCGSPLNRFDKIR